MSLFLSRFENDNILRISNNFNFVKDVLSNKYPVYLFGTNEFSEAISRSVQIEGFINDRSNESSFLGKPIVPLESISNDAIVICCVVLARPKFAIQKIFRQTNRVVDYFFFKKFSGLDLPNVIFEYGQCFNNEFEQNEEKYYDLFLKLEDNNSKDTLKRIVLFRLTADLFYLERFNYHPDKQYFDDCVTFGNAEVFLDVGSFDGYTSELFIKNCSNFKEIHVFEPDSSNMLKVKERLNVYGGKIKYHNFGLSNRTDNLKFNSSGSSSSINSEGDVEIKVLPLDDMQINDVTFLKMDIEGAEVKALEGARQTIINCHPKIAISVYHKIDDFWCIPQLILSFRSDYRIFLRHYTEGVTETVMYFIPKFNE